MRNVYERPQYTITRVAGVCGILFPLIIFICLALAISLSPWFTWTHHALSDLGISKSTDLLFNYGMIVGGICASIFSVGLIQILPRKTGGYLLFFSSLALIGIGVFPETIFALHFITSSSFFILLTIALFIIGLTMKQDRVEHGFGSLALFFSLVALGSTVFLVRFEGIAIPEALSCFPGFIWCFLVGLKMALFRF